MKTIPLTQGHVASVDDADYEQVSKFKWHAQKVGRMVYGARNVQRLDGSRTKQKLHQFLMPGVERVDHRNGDGLNNQRYNLRPATHEQNIQGFQRKKAGASSRYRGVSWFPRGGNWRARLEISGKQVHLGYFNSEADAARAYDASARKYFKDFAAPNFP